MTAPTALRPCGTEAAYHRHLAADELACTPCLDAHAAEARERYAAQRPTPVARYGRTSTYLDRWNSSVGIPFGEFHQHLGITAAAWRRAFYRAQAAQDPRARRRDLTPDTTARSAAA